MWEGNLVAIFITPSAGSLLTEVECVRAVPGHGLEGDRYFYHAGSFSRWPGPFREVTLIAREALDEMEDLYGTKLAPEMSRRNLLTAGTPLNDLIGQTFTIGDVTLKGIRLCQPCKYLARKTGYADLIRRMTDRGGLRARILTEGLLKSGDVIRPT